MEESRVSQIGSPAAVFLDFLWPYSEFALLWLGAFNAALILVAMVVVVWLLFCGSLDVHSDRKASTFRHLTFNFCNFPSLSITFRNIPPHSVTFHHIPSLSAMLLDCFSSCPSLSVNFRHEAGTESGLGSD